MQNARIFRTVSANDIYDGVQNEDHGVPPYRRATIPATRAKHLQVAEPVIAIAQPPAIRMAHEESPSNETERNEVTSAASIPTVAPAHSMRRMKATKRVVDLPEMIEEQMAAGTLLDPRRE